MAGRLLLADDDAALLRTLCVLLEDEGFEVVTAASGLAAREALLTQARFAAVISDLAMPGMGGLELLRFVREHDPELPVLLMTAFSSARTAVQAMQAGAFQYLAKPVDPEELLLLLRRAMDGARARAEHRRLAERTGDPEQFDVLVGNSAPMRELRATITRLAAVDSTVLLLGETGTGKELVARLIHRSGSRAERPFVVINCTAIPGELLESELFGHDKGAFTGASTARVGRIEEAEGGTVLLDEVGDMPPALQPKLLRFLQERSIQRVGGGRERRVDVRVIAATHRDLSDAMATGAFRADLYHRLNALPIHLPPLREHLEDLPALTSHMLAKLCRRLGRPAVEPPRELLANLASQSFAGNVRELENLLERAVVLGQLAGGAQTPPRPDASLAIPLDNGFQHLARLYEGAERELIRRALEAWPGLSHAEVAERLGTTRRVLELRLKQ